MNFTLYIILLFLLQTSIQNEDFESFISELDESYKKVNDYTCKLSKKELYHGKYTHRKNIIYKFKKPCFFYLNWTEGEDKGMEVIYAGKKYNNKSKVHTGGLMSVISVAIDPRGKKALDGCRHSILDSDFGSIIDLIKTNYKRAVKESCANIFLEKKAEVNGQKTSVYKIIFPQDNSYYGHIIYIYLCEKLNLPLKFVVYDKDYKLLEDYEFWDLKINVGLDDIDFDINNSKYKF